MDIILDILRALWQSDYETLANPSLAWVIYILLFVIIFLENGLLPAAFLPGDSLLVLVGVLISKDAMSFPVTLTVLTIAASTGCWLGYVQGKFLGNTKIVQGWLSHLPLHYHQRAYELFHRHGLHALLIGRFLAFIPAIAGLSGLNNARFQLFNWISGALWVLILISIGFFLGKTPLFLKHEDELMFILILLPLVLLISGLFGSLFILWKKKRARAKNSDGAGR